MIDGMAIPNCAKGYARTDAAGLRVRGAPETGAVLGKLNLDEHVTVWAVRDGWALVQTDDGRLTGWASMAYMQPVGELVA